MSSAAAPEPTPYAARTASARVAELFERHGRMVYGICRAMLRDVHDAEDAAQQTFLSAHRALLAGASTRDTGAWVATIARNECRTRIAAGMRQPLSGGDDYLAEVPNGVDEVERRLQAEELREALAELPERQREAVVLRYVFGLRYKEVAKALGLSRPATEALLFRARRSMRVRLRHAVGTVLVVPLAFREELALAIPGFSPEATSGAAAASVAGGVLAKLASAPSAAKLATAAVAVSTVGAVSVVEADLPASGRTDARLVAEPSSEVDAVVSQPEPVARDDGELDDHQSRTERRSGQKGEGGGPERELQAEGDDATEGASRRGSGTSRGESGRDEVGVVEDDESSGSSGASTDEAEPGDDHFGRGKSARSSEGSGSSGPGSGEPNEEESADDPDDGSGSSRSGSGSGDDGYSESSSGSDDGPELDAAP